MEKVITDQWTVNVRHDFNGVVVAMQFILAKKPIGRIDFRQGYNCV